MKIELTKEELLIINDLCFAEILDKSKMSDLRFIDKQQIETYIDKLKVLMDKVCIDK